MGIIRVKKTKNYTVMSNYHLKDKNLSLKAQGLLSIILSLPDDWDYSVAGLVAIVKDGKSAVQSALQELEFNNYVVRRRIKDDRGRIIDWEYIIFENPAENNIPESERKSINSPLTDFQDMGNTDVDNRDVGDMSQLNTKEQNTKKLNTKEKSTGAGASSKISHSRGFRRERQSLEDKLFSGEEIASQKKERKKESKYNRCLSEIDKRDFTDREKELLRQHIEWSFHSSDVNRNDEPRKYAKHLDELLELKGDKEKIIQRSIDKKWHCFYEFRSQNNANSYLDHSDSKIQLQTLSQEEAEAVLARDREEFGTI